MSGLPPVPTGLQRLLRLASVDLGFRRELLARRTDVAAAAGVPLTAHEAAVLRAVPEAQLAGMIDGLPAPAPDRRDFLRQAALAAVATLGGALAVGCGDDKSEPAPRRPHDREMETAGGAAPQPPPEPTLVDAGPPEPEVTRGIRPDVPAPPAGIRPDVPPPAPSGPAPTPAGVRPDPPPERPSQRDMTTDGGANPEVPPERPERRDTVRKGGADPKAP